MSSISRRIWVIRCRWPSGRGGSPGSVTSMRSSASRGRARRPRARAVRSLEQRLERRAHLVRRLADRAALLRRQLADRAQHLRSARPCGRGSARAAPRARAVDAGGDDRRPRPRLARAGPRLRHGRPSYCASVVQRDRGRHGHVERLGAVGAQRDPGACVGRARAARRAGPRARRRGRARPAARASATSASERSPRARRARAACRRSSSKPARAGGRANTEPMLARTALGENGSAQPGPSTTGPSASAWAERMIVPDVARVVDAVQVDATARRRAPTSAAGRRRPRACPSRACSRSSSSSRLHVLARHAAGSRAPSRRPRRPRPGPRPRPRTGRACSRQRFCWSLRIVLSCSLSGDQ